MTLANFNSNFNWQLRMLKEAADCCGIVPDVPPTPGASCFCYEVTLISGTCIVEYIDCAGVSQSTPIGGRDPLIIYVCAQENTVNPVCLAPFNSAVVTGGTVACTDSLECQPPVPPIIAKSMWVGYLADTSGGSFSNFPTDWILNGDLLFNAVTLITSPPYSGNGYAIQVYDPFDPYCTGCLFRAYTIEDIGFAMPTPWIGTDNEGKPISMSFTEITTKKNFSGTITPGSDSINALVTGSFSDSLDFPQFVSDPMVSTYLTIIFQRLFGSQASVTVVVNGGGSFTITVSNIYTTDTQIGFFMGDSVTYYIPEV